jgi:hypothetical protein
MNREEQVDLDIDNNTRRLKSPIRIHIQYEFIPSNAKGQDPFVKEQETTPPSTSKLYVLPALLSLPPSRQSGSVDAHS